MINFYRLDDIEFNGVYGGKAEIANKLCRGQKGIVTCGSRNSVQVITFAKVCEINNVDCYVHIPKGNETETTRKLLETKAHIVYENVGYNNVLNAHAKTNAEKLGYKFVRLGMLCEEAFDIISNNTMKLLDEYPNTKRIVTVIGSGTTMIGICRYLESIKSNIPVVGISVGMDASKNISSNTSYTNYEINKSSMPYNKYVKNEYGLNETYEAKCLPFLQDGDTLYVVAK